MRCLPVAAQTFTELVVLDEAHPCAIGTRLRVVAGTITELEAIFASRMAESATCTR